MDDDPVCRPNRGCPHLHVDIRESSSLAVSDQIRIYEYADPGGVALKSANCRAGCVQDQHAVHAHLHELELWEAMPLKPMPSNVRVRESTVIDPSICRPPIFHASPYYTLLS